MGLEGNIVRLNFWYQSGDVSQYQNKESTLELVLSAGGVDARTSQREKGTEV